MNLRNAENYLVGLDIGTGSVGYAIVDENGELYKFKGKNTWGVRLFDGASTAATTRTHRGMRRRYNRRKQRLADLQQFLLPELEKVDPGFLARMKQSALISEDRTFNEQYVLFNSKDFTEREYYAKYPTIYHLRCDLIESKDQADIRLVYLALHHMLKYRGNFLMEGDVSASDADASDAIEAFLGELQEFCGMVGIEYSKDAANEEALNAAVSGSEHRRNGQEKFSGALNMDASQKKLAKALGDAVFGYQVEFAVIFQLEASSDTKFKLDNDEKVEKFESELVPDEGALLFETLKNLHNAYLLSGILKGEKGKSLSYSMVAKYETYKKDLNELKQLVRRTFPADENGTNKVYNKIFRGAHYANEPTKYAKSKDKVQGYTAYDLGLIDQDEFYKQLKKIFTDATFASDSDKALWETIQQKMDDGSYLMRLRTYENGSIPHQFHLEEMRAIINNQRQYYPALAENQSKIESLLSFRIPYYVGPLGKNKSPNRQKPFGWAIRKEGMEGVPAKPWNFEDVIDKDATAEAFITNLTGECSYWYGKKAIPKSSLLYSEYCVRQELNCCTISTDGGSSMHRFDIEEAESIINGVFKTRKRVKVKDVLDFLNREYPNTSYGAVLKGTQKENEFASSLSSYNDFKKILGREIESYEDIKMVENLISWVTIFEDKKILKHKIETEYGKYASEPKLTDEQVMAIGKLRYTGWSRLSREFLTELRVDFNGGRVCIMDILRNSRKRTPMILMEILADERFGFKEKLEEVNKEYLEAEHTGLDDIPGSPAIKRGINQALKVVDEIIEITGKAPGKICIEMAREEVGKGKGSRTKTREKKLKEAYDAISKDAVYKDEAENKHWYKELNDRKDQLNNDEIYLYLMQRGKCMYCGKTIDINNANACHIDHIVPRTMIKDDSIENRVLVHHDCNERKGDEYPIKESIRLSGTNRALWKELRSVGLIGDKKFNELRCDNLSDEDMMRFINRQLVETRQITKHVVQILKARYPETIIETINADLSHNLRTQYGYIKNRDVNDYHHAHDAYLACQMSRFLNTRFLFLGKALDYGKYRWLSDEERRDKRGHSGLIVNSFKISGFDHETGEIKRDAWDADFEMARIRKCLGYKDCFVSRKVEKLKGEFWNQTVYSPRIKTEKAIPLKQGLDPMTYGYYQSPNSAYYALIEHTGVVRNKQKRVVELVGIPVDASYRIASASDLGEYLSEKYVDVRVLKAPIMKYQKITWAGADYYLTSSMEMINARQLCVPERFMRFLDEANKKEETEYYNNGNAREFFDYLCEQVKEYYPRYNGVYKKLRDDKTVDYFEKLALSEKLTALYALLKMLHCDASHGLTSMSLSTSAGRMMNLNVGASISDIEFIDTSVTGMFERRYKIEI